MRTFLRVSKWLGITIAALVALVCLAVLAVWLHPAMLLNERTVRWALRHETAGTEARWSHFSWVFQREGFWGKRSDLEIQGLCFKQGTLAEGCVPEFHLDVSFSLARFKPSLTKIHSVVFDATNLTVHRASAAPKPAAKKSGPLPDLRPPLFASVAPAIDVSTLGNVLVRLASFTAESADGPPVTASLELSKVEGASFAFGLEAGESGSFRAHLNGTGTLGPSEFHGTGLLNLQTATGWKLRFPLDLAWSDRVHLRGSPMAVHGSDRYSTPLALDWSARQLRLDVGRLALDKLWPPRRVLVDSCSLQSELDGKAGYPKKTQLGCGVSVLKLGSGVILPPLHTQFDAHLDLATRGEDDADVILAVKENGKNDYLDTRLNFHGKGRVRVAQLAPVGTPELALDFTARLPELQKWKAALDRTPLALPAPFRVLSGPATLGVKLVHVTHEELALNATLDTSFRGAKESFVTKHAAAVHVAYPFGGGAKSVRADANLELTDVELEAPPLQLATPPQFLPDRRFDNAPARAAAKGKAAHPAVPVTWQASIRTKSPVRIRTNLLKDEIPVALDLHLRDSGDMAGTISIEPMPLEVFKKKAEVKEIKVAYEEGSKAGDLDGVVVVRNPDVTVRILLLGSTEKPRIEFESDPPLERNQIVSVLLFNKLPDELTEDEASSTGSFSQATADGALGLFSLFFLSSTPVESISYDPVSQTYSARLRLDKKTTLSVGSDFDKERQVALRRRLGGRWAIRTELHDTQGEGGVLLTLLEWFKRF